MKTMSLDQSGNHRRYWNEAVGIIQEDDITCYVDDLSGISGIAICEGVAGVLF